MLDRVIDGLVEKALAEPKLLEQWFCPKSWYVIDAHIDLRPGGELSSVMHGPNGGTIRQYWCRSPRRTEETVGDEGCVPSVGFLEGVRSWVAERLFQDAGDGKTRYTAHAMHWDGTTLKEHERIGFCEGWGKAADHRSARRVSLVGAENEPCTITVHG